MIYYATKSILLIIFIADISLKIVIKWKNKYRIMDAESTQDNSMPV